MFLLKLDEDQKEVLESVCKIGEELQKCPIRREKDQKDSFRNIVAEQFKGIDIQLEEDETEYIKYKNIKKCNVNNIYSTEPLDYKVILMAHYDTPGNFLFSLPLLIKLCGAGVVSFLCYSVILLIILMGACSAISSYWNLDISYIGFLLSGVLLIDVLYFLVIPNKHNANDNTSGVITVLAIAKYISKHRSDLASRIKIVLTDKEEKGLFGAQVLRKKLGSSVDNKLILNFDGVGNGSHLNLQYNTKKIDSDVIQSLYNHLEPVVDSSKIVTGKIGGSDYDIFKKEACFGFVFVKPSIFPFGYYIPNMHTNKDTYINEEHLAKFGLQISKFIIEYIDKNSDVSIANKD